jgi:hypothetical protein
MKIWIALAVALAACSHKAAECDALVSALADSEAKIKTVDVDTKPDGQDAALEELAASNRTAPGSEAR